MSAERIRGVVQKAWKSTSAAFVLSCVAGLVDAVGYIQLYHLFMGFMSGNSIVMGLSLGLGHWTRAFLHMIPIFWFLVGVGFGTQLMAIAATRGIRSPTGLMLSIEAALICAYLLSVHHLLPLVGLPKNWNGIWGLVLLAAFLAIAMGIQTATLHRAGGHSIHTTFITGVLTRFTGQTLSAVRKSGAGKEAEGLLSVEKSLWLALTYILYVLGAVTGAWGLANWGVVVLFAAVGILLAAVVLDLLNPLPASMQVF
ncbi:MAG: YoaK family protein [Syntrophobacteraceae bacterium]